MCTYPSLSYRRRKKHIGRVTIQISMIQSRLVSKICKQCRKKRGENAVLLSNYTMKVLIFFLYFFISSCCCLTFEFSPFSPFNPSPSTLFPLPSSSPSPSPSPSRSPPFLPPTPPSPSPTLPSPSPVAGGSSSDGLSVDFYSKTCPNADQIVRNTMSTLANQSNVVTPSTLRLFAHDCFVEGCDASILITSTPKNTAERDATENNIPQQAFDAIIQSKKALETACPGVVSCADIVVMAARDAVALAGGPHWEVPKGRRDGLISQASRVAGHLPGADFNVSQLTENFAAVNLNTDDMVILSGAHTLGFSHCNQFRSRLYSFGGTKNSDPSINSTYIQTLKSNCPSEETGPGKFNPFDVSSPFGFDNSYYKNLQIGKGLLFADQVLFNDNATRPLINRFANSQDDFFTAFVQAMVKMSRIGVKTGSQGEIRQSCTSFNGQNLTAS